MALGATHDLWAVGEMEHRADSRPFRQSSRVGFAVKIATTSVPERRLSHGTGVSAVFEPWIAADFGPDF